MELDWSEQSQHIRTLFRPWQPGDGYDEDIIQAAEERVDVRLPTPLRAFYLAWGHRRDLANMVHPLLNPERLLIQEDTLQFWVENQAVVHWGVRREALTEVDPPVVVTESGPELHWTQSHGHLSSFLDDMTYLHAFSSGAIHGGASHLYLPNLLAHQIAWLEEHWNKATVTALAFGLDLDPTFGQLPTLYVRDGQAFWEFSGSFLAAREAEAIDEISQRFQITWSHRW